MHPLEIVRFLAPYQFSLLAVVVFAGAAILYASGLKRLRLDGSESPNRWRQFSFWLGLGLSYSVLHTRLDYYSQYLFFAHRAQHLVLHHLGALLIALGNPLPVWRRVMPVFPEQSVLIRGLDALWWLLRQPVVAAVLFVGLIFFWLWPGWHFDAMLSHPLYLTMNWSMLLDGVLFWLIILDPRSPLQSRLPSYAVRMAMLFSVTVPQIVLGAYLTFSRSSLYDVYAVCGRAWPISAQRDQIIGGLLTWIPPAMMAVVAALLVLSMILRRDRQLSHRPEEVRA